MIANKITKADLIAAPAAVRRKSVARPATATKPDMAVELEKYVAKDIPGGSLAALGGAVKLRKPVVHPSIAIIAALKVDLAKARADLEVSADVASQNQLLTLSSESAKAKIEKQRQRIEEYEVDSIECMAMISDITKQLKLLFAYVEYLQQPVSFYQSILNLFCPPRKVAMQLHLQEVQQQETGRQ